MAGLGLTYEVNDREVQAMLARLERFDRQALANDIGMELVSSTQQRFRAGVSPAGEPWIPSERALFEGGKTLVDHGHLRDSITYMVYLDGSGLEVGTNLVYAAIHQFGGRAGRNHAVKLRARPFLGVSADDEEAIDAILAEHLRGAVQ